jgi:hypothetical protein
VTRGGKSWAPLLLIPPPCGRWWRRQWQRQRQQWQRQQRAMATGIQGARNRRCPMHSVNFYNIQVVTVVNRSIVLMSLSRAEEFSARLVTFFLSAQKKNWLEIDILIFFVKSFSIFEKD